MKIGPPTDNSARVGTTAQPVPQTSGQSSGTPAAPAGKRAPASGVAVTVSTLARTLEAAAAAEASDIDSEKVESVKTAIQQGTYTVNAEAIADKLLANAQEMLNRSRD